MWLYKVKKKESWRQEGAGDENRSTLWLRCEIFIRSVYTSNTHSSLHPCSVFARTLHLQQQQTGMESHARSKLSATHFVIDHQDSGLQPNISGQNATLAIFPRYLSPSWLLLASVFMAKCKCPDDSSLRCAIQRVSLQCNHRRPSARLLVTRQPLSFQAMFLDWMS